ncbi:MAG TPA: hypothetical protein DCM05_11270 [Elusimicrobia bacterium]|nr:hypothetical protein [Elusimicrobiota bacterium]
MTCAAALLLLLLACPVSSEEKGSLVGTTVRSKEYVIRRAPRKQEEFIGEVSYRHGIRSVSAEWALFDHDAESWKSRGRIRAEDRLKDGSVLVLTGEEASHSLKTGLGELRPMEGGRVLLTRTAGGFDAGQASARRLRWDEKAGTVRLLEDVRVESAFGDASARSALYRRSDRSMTLTGGRPFAAPRQPGWTAAVQADEIRATEQPEVLSASGTVRGWLHFVKEAEASDDTRSFWRFWRPKRR